MGHYLLDTQYVEKSYSSALDYSRVIGMFVVNLSTITQSTLVSLTDNSNKQKIYPYGLHWKCDDVVWLQQLNQLYVDCW